MGRCKQRGTWKEERDGWMLLRATWKTVDLAWMSRSTRSRGWTLFSGWMSMAMKFHKCSEFDQMDFDDLEIVVSHEPRLPLPGPGVSIICPNVCLIRNALEFLLDGIFSERQRILFAFYV
jgi:hypothetical protein